MQHHYNHFASTNIVQDVLNQSILDKASKFYMPRQLIYHQCCRLTENIHFSMLNINQAHPDLNSADLYTQNQIIKDSSSIDLKREKIPSYYPQSRLKVIGGQYNTVSKAQVQLSGKYLNNEKMKNNSSHSKLKSSLQIKLPEQRLLPCLTSFEYDQKNENSVGVRIKKNLGHKEQEKIDQVIKNLRQNKLNSNPQFGYSIDRHLAIKKDQIRKIKQNQSKKCLVISTNYEGQIVPLNRNQINRQIPHYIDLQIGVSQQGPQTNKIKLNLYTNEKQNGLNKQFANYKEIKIAQKQDIFTCGVLRKINQAKMPKRILNEADFLEEFSKENKQSPLKFIGKNSKPIRVGFNLFEKLKKKMHGLEKCIQQNKQQNNDLSDSLLKKSSHKKKESRKSIQFGPVQESIGQKQRKKKQNINLGNHSAINFLLNQARKYKKTVKINEQFL